jgi:hypothetical protein
LIFIKFGELNLIFGLNILILNGKIIVLEIYVFENYLKNPKSIIDKIQLLLFINLKDKTAFHI